MFATLVIKNAKIITMENNQICSSMAIVEELIVALGSYEDVVAYIGADTKVVDAKGSCFLPGLIDSQVQLFNDAYFFESEDLSLVRSKELLIQILKKRIISEDIKEKQWLFGHNCLLIEEHQSCLLERDLARISMHHPILILSVDQQSGVINKLGLEMLGMDRFSDINIEGGFLTAKPLEKIKHNLRMQSNIESLKKTIMNVSTRLSHQGITSIHTDDRFGFGYNGEINELYRAYEQLRNEDKLLQRIYHQVQSISDQELRTQFDQIFRSGDGNTWFKIGALKLKATGSSVADCKLERTIAQCHSNNFQVLLEAHDVLELKRYSSIIKRLDQQSGNKRKLRHILQLKSEGIGLNSDDNCLVAGYSSLCSSGHDSQTVFQRLQEIAEFHCYGLEPHISIKKLLSMFTINAAKIEFSDKEKGSLKIGKLADFIEIDYNPYDLPLDRLGEIKVMNTYINGKQLYSS